MITRWTKNCFKSLWYGGNIIAVPISAYQMDEWTWAVAWWTKALWRKQLNRSVITERRTSAYNNSPQWHYECTINSSNTRDSTWRERTDQCCRYRNKNQPGTSSTYRCSTFRSDIRYLFQTILFFSRPRTTPPRDGSQNALKFGCKQIESLKFPCIESLMFPTGYFDISTCRWFFSIQLSMDSQNKQNSAQRFEWTVKCLCMLGTAGESRSKGKTSMSVRQETEQEAANGKGKGKPVPVSCLSHSQYVIVNSDTVNVSLWIIMW